MLIKKHLMAILGKLEFASSLVCFLAAQQAPNQQRPTFTMRVVKNLPPPEPEKEPGDQVDVSPTGEITAQSRGRIFRIIPKANQIRGVIDVMLAGKGGSFDYTYTVGNGSDAKRDLSGY
jgi:hypothetical protein